MNGTSAQIDPVAFGEFKGAVQTSLSENTKAINEMKTEIKEQFGKLVTHDQLEATIRPVASDVKETKAEITNVSQRVKDIEDVQTARSASIWTKIGLSFEAGVVKFLGGGLIIAAGLVVFMMMQNDANVQRQTLEALQQSISEAKNEEVNQPAK